MVSDLLRELVGREVSAWTRGPHHVGTVQDVGDRWMHLASGVLGALLIPTASIRLIKKADGGMTAQSAAGDLQPSLLGRTVSVTSGDGAGFSDTGELEAFDDDWLRVRVKSAQFYFAVRSIDEVRVVQGQT